MAPRGGGRGSAQPRKAASRPTRSSGPPRGRSGRVQKRPTGSHNNNNRRHIEQAIDREHSGEARDKVPRKRTTLHACSDQSLHFIAQAHLDTDADCNTLTLNLMDFFLFTANGLLPAALAYCKLHAACFLLASRLTGKGNTAGQIAASLAPETEFVRAMAAPLAGDEDSAVAIARVLGVGTEGDVEAGYELLCKRVEVLKGLMGEYAAGVGSLPTRTMVEEEENFDLFEEEEEAD